MGICTCECKCPWIPEEGTGYSGVGVTAICQLPNGVVLETFWSSAGEIRYPNY